MEKTRAEGKRSVRYRVEEEEEEEEDEDVGELGFEEEERKKRALATPSSKKGYGSTPPCCQADNCNVDLSNAKRYHRRHKVCEFHAKAAVVVIGGLHQRFCQQCSRFQELSEFDENKRSCRSRLAGHNERRRKSLSDGSLGGESSTG